MTHDANFSKLTNKNQSLTNSSCLTKLFWVMIKNFKEKYEPYAVFKHAWLYMSL